MSNAKRARQAKERLDAHLQANDATPPEESGSAPRDLDEWTDIVGQRIEQAMRDGAFDNLPGRGKPLNLSKNPFTSEDKQMAFKLLENNDLKPAWISERSEVLAAVERLRGAIRATAQWYGREARRTDDLSASDRLVESWSVQLTQWTDDIAELNRRIEGLNLQQPSPQLEVFKVRLDDELAAIGLGRELR